MIWEGKVLIVKIAVVATLCSVLVTQIKNLKAEYGQLLLIAVGLFLFFFAAQYLESITEVFDILISQISIRKTYIVILMKMIGIAYVCEFASNLCKDSGCQTIATQVEMIGKLSILLISTPIITALAEMMTQLI